MVVVHRDEVLVMVEVNLVVVLGAVVVPGAVVLSTEDEVAEEDRDDLDVDVGVVTEVELVVLTGGL
jgi:hypothetical protein